MSNTRPFRQQRSRQALRAVNPSLLNSSTLRSNMPIYGVGFLDSIGFLQYFANFDQTYFNLIIIFLKINLLVFSRWDLRSTIPAIPLIGTILFGLFVSSGFNSVDFVDVARVIIATFSIILTVIIIDGDFKKYAIGLAANGFIISALYIMQYRAGSLIEVYGRLDFFNGQHPNLGGEILSIIVILSTASLRPIAFSALFTVSAYCCWLMQSRTSILAMIVAAILYGAFWSYKRFTNVQATLLLGCFIFGGSAFLLIEEFSGSNTPTQIFEFFSNSIFLVEDSYRGADSGLSGRDLHWFQTLEIIDSNFLVGAGIEYPRRLDILQPHNWFLYPIALFGIFGFPVIAAMIHALGKIAFTNKDELVRVIPILILLMLNDRFMNLNINPLGMYVYLFARLYRPVPYDGAYRRVPVGRSR